MTLQAVEPVRVTIDPQRYSWCPPLVLPEQCSIPGCTSSFRLEKHHIVRRSATGGPTDYITIDGLVVTNVCMLCREHHAMVTGEIGGHKLWIIRGARDWIVVKPGPPGEYGPVSKDGTTWVWVGPLRAGNLE